MDKHFVEAVQALVAELQRESASGLITRKALVALDRVQQLLDAVPAGMQMPAKNLSGPGPADMQINSL